MMKSLAKVTLILHLSFAFSLFLWVLFDPFMGEHFRMEQDRLLIKNLKGDASLYSKASPSETQELKAFSKLWDRMEPGEKEFYEHEIRRFESLFEKPSLDRFFNGVFRLVFKTPFYLTAWIVLSVVISILCLKGRKRGYQTVFVLPLLVILYALDSRPSYEEPFIPKESVLVKKYLTVAPTGSLIEQKEKLSQAFNQYLVETWAKETPSKDPAIFQLQLAKGKFGLNKAKLLRRIKNNFETPITKEAPFFLWAYLIWNSLVVFILLIDKRQSRQSIQSSPAA
ncbi:MAG: hypothetical protein KDK62_05925 [Chlamydiia bacterium]|nr:hypothetical protein [Chlamydiia bacterium]